MNEVLEINGLIELLDFVNRKSAGGATIALGPILIKLESLRASINRGCSCRKKARTEHAEAVFRDSMINASLRDRKELSDILGVGKDYGLVIIKSGEQALLRLEG
jgi:hypothetical protein